MGDSSSRTRMTDGEKYCGFLCDAITEKQEEIADEIAELWKVNPDFATQFAGRMIRMLVESVSPPK